MASRNASTLARSPDRGDTSSMPPAMMQLDRQLCFALYSSSLAMTKLYKPVLEPLGLTYPQYLVMLVLWEGTAPGVAELGHRLFLDSGTLTPLLKRMEAGGWLTRERAAEDERRVLVRLTPAGRALRRKARGLPARVACASRSTSAELIDLTARLRRLRDNVTADRTS